MRALPGRLAFSSTFIVHLLRTGAWAPRRVTQVSSGQVGQDSVVTVDDPTCGRRVLQKRHRSLSRPSDAVVAGQKAVMGPMPVHSDALWTVRGYWRFFISFLLLRRLQKC